MGLVKCFDCGAQISRNADRCPKCGTIDTPMARRQEIRGNDGRRPETVVNHLVRDFLNVLLIIGGILSVIWVLFF